MVATIVATNVLETACLNENSGEQSRLYNILLDVYLKMDVITLTKILEKQSNVFK